MSTQDLGLSFPVLISWSFPKLPTGGHGQEDPALLFDASPPSITAPPAPFSCTDRVEAAEIFHLHTLEASGEDRAQESLWRKGSMLDREPKPSCNPQHPLGRSKAFFPSCSRANWAPKSSSKGEKLQISIGHRFQRDQPATPIHPHSPSHWHLTQRGCRC